MKLQGWGGRGGNPVTRIWKWNFKKLLEKSLFHFLLERHHSSANYSSFYAPFWPLLPQAFTISHLSFPVSGTPTFLLLKSHSKIHFCNIAYRKSRQLKHSFTASTTCQVSAFTVYTVQHSVCLTLPFLLCCNDFFLSASNLKVRISYLRIILEKQCLAFLSMLAAPLGAHRKESMFNITNVPLCLCASVVQAHM